MRYTFLDQNLHQVLWKNVEGLFASSVPAHQGHCIDGDGGGGDNQPRQIKHIAGSSSECNRHHESSTKKQQQEKNKKENILCGRYEVTDEI
jgi:hypothetical protein